MEQAYAQALWKLIEGGAKPAEALKSLHEQLKKTGRVMLLKKIESAFKRLAQRKLSSGEARLYVANEKTARAAVKEAAAALNLPDGDMRVCVDESIIGGWRFEEKERMLDASFKKHLLSLYNRATSV